MNHEGPLNDSYAGINYIKTVHKSSMFSYLALTFMCYKLIGIQTEDGENDTGSADDIMT